MIYYQNSSGYYVKIYNITTMTEEFSYATYSYTNAFVYKNEIFLAIDNKLNKYIDGNRIEYIALPEEGNVFKVKEKIHLFILTKTNYAVKHYILNDENIWTQVENMDRSVVGFKKFFDFSKGAFTFDFSVYSEQGAIPILITDELYL